MRKPELVCAVGSAVLAPVLFMSGAAFVMALFWYLGVDSHIPDWMGWMCMILALMLVPFVLFNFYRWLFRHCQRAAR